MSHWDQHDQECYGCEGVHEGSMVMIDLSPEGRGEHRPICMACMEEKHRTREFPVRDLGGRTVKLYTIAPRKFVDDIEGAVHRGRRDGGV